MDRKESEKSLKYKIKVVFMGDKGVGKSSVISKFAFNKFEENTQV
jgi:GTPase SAR1 family protein